MQSLFRLEQLRKLTLSDNQLSRITADFASLVNLQELDVSKNGKFWLKTIIFVQSKFNQASLSTSQTIQLNDYCLSYY